MVEYDDGVYFGASINLVHGIIPYKDFALVQPPLITILLAPFAVLASAVGTKDAMELARVFTDLISLVNVVLVALILRKRSAFRQTLGTAIMALSSSTLQASQTILIEPYLVTFCLVAVLVIFEGEELTSSKTRIFSAGVIFGLAGATKTWAIFPVLVMLYLLHRKGGGLWWRMLLGTSIGFALTVLPFFIYAPTSFVKQVIIAQALRPQDGVDRLVRMAMLTGIPGISQLAKSNPTLGWTLVAVIYLSAILILYRSLRRTGWVGRSDLAKSALGGATLIGLVLTFAPSYFYHYGAFLAPYLAVLFATLNYDFISRRFQNRIHISPALNILVVVGLLITFFLADIGVVTSPPKLRSEIQITPAISAALATPGCTWSSEPSLMLLANDFTADRRGCPHMVDYEGTTMEYLHVHLATTQTLESRRLQNLFFKWIRQSAVVVAPTYQLTPSTVRYLTEHFRRIFLSGKYSGFWIYKRSHGIKE